jgi:hypothetical protein
MNVVKRVLSVMQYIFSQYYIPFRNANLKCPFIKYHVYCQLESFVPVSQLGAVNVLLFSINMSDTNSRLTSFWEELHFRKEARFLLLRLSVLNTMIVTNASTNIFLVVPHP